LAAGAAAAVAAVAAAHALIIAGLLRSEFPSGGAATKA